MRSGGEVGDEGPGIIEAALVGVVLNTHQIQSSSLRSPHQTLNPLRRVRQRLREDAELQLSTIVAHLFSSSCVMSAYEGSSGLLVNLLTGRLQRYVPRQSGDPL